MIENINSNMKTMNDNISAMLTNIHYKSDKEIGKNPQTMSVQNTEFSSKQSENIQNEVLTITSEHPYS